MPAPALESAQATLQGVQVLMTRQGGRDEAEMGGRREGGSGEEAGYKLAAGSSASNERLKGSTLNTVGHSLPGKRPVCQQSGSLLADCDSLSARTGTKYCHVDNRL